MKTYANIVFMQGWEAEEPLALLVEDPQLCLDYLKQWDSGEYYDTTEATSAGTNDRKILFGDYQIIYNSGIGYIGLEKTLNN
jgi:hypothetical protein